MTNTHKGLIAVHSAVLIFGGTALFSKLIALSALDITLLRSILAAIAIGVIFFWKKEPLQLISKRDYGIILLIGLLLAIHWVTYFHAMQISSIAIGVVALYTFPIMTVFLEPLFSAQRLRIQDIISALAVLFGVYLLIPEFSLNNQVTQGILWGMLSAFCFALRNLLQGHYFKGYSARHSLFYQTLVTFIVLIPFSYQIIPEVSNFQWGQLIILGLIFTALPHTLFAFSLLNLKTKTASLISCIQVVYATTFAILLLGEKLEITTFIGGIIVISVAMYESYSSAKR